MRFLSPSGLEEFRAGPSGVLSRVRGTLKEAWGPWGRRSLRSLLAYPADSEVWAKLGKSGVVRPRLGGPSGKGGRNPPRALRGPMVEAKLSTEAAAALERLAARYGSKSEAVEAAVLAHDLDLRK